MERILEKPIGRLLLLFPLVCAGLSGNSSYLLAQNPAPVVQSAVSIQVSAQVVSPEMVFVWPGLLNDSEGTLLEALRVNELVGRETRAERGILIVTEPVDPLSRFDVVGDPMSRPAEPYHLRVSLVFTAN